MSKKSLLKLFLLFCIVFTTTSCKQLKFVQFSDLAFEDYQSELKGDIKRIVSKQYFLNNFKKNKDTTVLTNEVYYNKKNQIIKSIESYSYLDFLGNVYTYYYDKNERLIEIKCQGIPFLKKEYKNGRLSKQTSFYLGEVAVVKDYFYDKKNNIIKVSSNNLKDNKKWIEHYIIDYEKLTSENYSIIEGKENNEYVLKFFYDEKGKILKYERINKESKEIFSVVEYSYDNYRNIIEKKQINNKNVVTSIHKIKFSYDDWQNVVRKEEFENGKLIRFTTYEITYF